MSEREKAKEEAAPPAVIEACAHVWEAQPLQGYAKCVLCDARQAVLL